MAVKVSVAGSGTTTASLSTVNPNVKISTIGIQGPAGTGIDLSTAGTLTASKAIIVDSDSKIDVLKSGDLVITGSANTIGHTDDTDLLTIASGTLTVAGTTITTSLTIGGTGVTSTADELNILDGVTSTATELNIVDGDTSAGTTAVAGGDGIVTNDGGTMRQTTVDTFDTYLSATTKTLTNKTLTTPTIAEIDSGSTITLDATTDIVLDADGGDIFFKDGGTTFGSATNTSGNLIIKSGTTTAATFSGANVTFAGTLAATSIDGGSYS